MEYRDIWAAGSGEYGSIGVYLLIGVVLGLVMVGASYLVVSQEGQTEKLTTYECGFEPYEDARGKFDVRFYLVGMLFIVFDLEACFMYPWAVTLGQLGDGGYWAMVDFLVELSVGYVYAWRIGALEW